MRSRRCWIGLGSTGSYSHHAVSRPYTTRSMRATSLDMQEWLPRYDALVFHSARYRDWEFAAKAGAPAAIMHVFQNAADDPSAATSRVDDRETRVRHGRQPRAQQRPRRLHRGCSRNRRRSIRTAASSSRRRGGGVDFARGCQPKCFVESVTPGEPDPRSSMAACRDAVRACWPTQTSFCSRRRIECAPVVILEAMAAGVPWVSYDVGNVRELAGGSSSTAFDELVDAGIRLAQTPDARATTRRGRASRMAASGTDGPTSSMRTSGCSSGSWPRPADATGTRSP